MCIAVVGNEEALGWDWMAAAARAGFDLRMVHPPLVSAISEMEGIDALMILQEGVSDEIQEQAVRIAASKGIPSMCATCEAAHFCRANSFI